MEKSLTMSAKNKAFWRMGKQKQRVAIAKDVIKQVRLLFFKPKFGIYLAVKSLRSPINNPDDSLDKLFTQLKKQDAACEVCGIGSCFASLVNLGDKIKTEDVFGEDVKRGDEINDTDMRVLLRQVFDPPQLTLIECAFEGADYFYDDKDRSPDWIRRGAAERFGKKQRSATNRLIAIMKNIIKNKGTFIP